MSVGITHERLAPKGRKYEFCCNHETKALIKQLQIDGYVYKPEFSFRTIEWLYMHHMYIPPFDEDDNIEDLLLFLSFAEYEKAYGPTYTYGKNPAFK